MPLPRTLVMPAKVVIVKLLQLAKIITVSEPSPPSIMSSPPLESITSLPEVPVIVLLEIVPVIETDSLLVSVEPELHKYLPGL